MKRSCTRLLFSFYSSYLFAASATISRKSVEAQSTAIVITIGAANCTAALHHFFDSTELVSCLHTTTCGAGVRQDSKQLVSVGIGREGGRRIQVCT